MKRILPLFVLAILAITLLVYNASSGIGAPKEPAKKPEAETEQGKIDKAVDRGLEFLLKTKYTRGAADIEIVVLTLSHAGLTEDNPKFKEMVSIMLQKDEPQVYTVSLRAMALESINRVKYQEQIAECAQGLVNYQAKNGQWGYDAKYYKGKDIKPVVTAEPPKVIEVITDSASPVPTKKDNKTESKKEEKLKSYAVSRSSSNRPPSGDNSNAQFALLGLRAAARAGVAIPKEVWEDAAKWWVKDQEKEGGWAYSYGGTIKGSSYGSMTAAGICGLAICKCYLGEDYKNDPVLLKALEWIGSVLSFSENPNTKKSTLFQDETTWLYYYIYGIERIGAIMDMERLGDKDWYKMGAEYLLSKQAKDGSWNSMADDRYLCGIVPDTCFAILFLRKATPVMKTKPVSTEGEEKKIETPSGGSENK
ncbi:MAG: prenyltransferase/squalene oxidase repeat-containing protein [Planctomycetota bacterium]